VKLADLLAGRPGLVHALARLACRACGAEALSPLPARCALDGHRCPRCAAMALDVVALLGERGEVPIAGLAPLPSNATPAAAACPGCDWCPACESFACGGFHGKGDA
jgi:hypothetical protein